MFKKIVTCTVLFVFLLNTAGCTGVWRRKFIRKKKGEEKQEPVLQPMDYKKEFNNRQFYANHYAFWRNAEAELISSVKGKRGEKRIKTYAGYAESEIEKLYDLIMNEKQKEFMPLVDELKELISKAAESNYLNSNRNHIAKALTKHYRNVSRNFTYFKMKKYIRPDDEEIASVKEGPQKMPAIEDEPAEEEQAQPTTEDKVVQERPEPSEEVVMEEERPQVAEEKDVVEQESSQTSEEKIADEEEAQAPPADDNKTLDGVTDFDINELNQILEKYDIEPYQKQGEALSEEEADNVAGE